VGRRVRTEGLSFLGGGGTGESYLAPKLVREGLRRNIEDVKFEYAKFGDHGARISGPIF